MSEEKKVTWVDNRLAEEHYDDDQPIPGKSEEYIKGYRRAWYILVTEDFDRAFDWYEYHENDTPNKIAWSKEYTLGYLDGISEYLNDELTKVRKEKEDIDRLLDICRLERETPTEEDTTNE